MMHGRIEGNVETIFLNVDCKSVARRLQLWFKAEITINLSQNLINLTSHPGSIKAQFFLNQHIIRYFIHAHLNKLLPFNASSLSMLA